MLTSNRLKCRRVKRHLLRNVIMELGRFGWGKILFLSSIPDFFEGLQLRDEFFIRFCVNQAYEVKRYQIKHSFFKSIMSVFPQYLGIYNCVSYRQQEQEGYHHHHRMQAIVIKLSLSFKSRKCITIITIPTFFFGASVYSTKHICQKLCLYGLGHRL